MSIAAELNNIINEIPRLQTAKANIKTAIENKGVTVGDGTIDTYAELISQITGGSIKNYTEGTITFEDTNETSPTVEHNLGVVPDIFLLLPDYEVDYTINAENAVIILKNDTLQSFILNTENKILSCVFETRTTYGTYGAWFTVNNGELTKTTAKLPQRSASYRYRAGVPYKWIAATIEGEISENNYLPNNITAINGGTWTQETALGAGGTLEIEHGLTDIPDAIIITSDIFEIAPTQSYYLASMGYKKHAIVDETIYASTDYAVYRVGEISTRVNYAFDQAQQGITAVDENKFTITAASNRQLGVGVTYSWVAMRWAK